MIRRKDILWVQKGTQHDLSTRFSSFNLLGVEEEIVYI